MGPLSDHQLTIAPAFWITMADLMGPVTIYVPGHAKGTRNNKVMAVKCYVSVFACPTTKCINLQVIEGKSADAFVDGLNRLGCEVGFPSYFLIDKESAIMKALKEADVSLKDMQHVVYKERGIKFKTCPIGGHNFHGLVERKIRSVEECLEKAGIFKERLHATGLQTVLKLAENEINNLPYGYMYGRDSDNSPLLKLICPNFLKAGRINTRCLDGPITLPKSPGELMDKIKKCYGLFYEVWNTVMIPKLMAQKIWFDNKGSLNVGDIVYFKKEEKEITSTWTLGIVESIVKGSDEVVREVTIKYQNANEDVPRYTERAARTIKKLFHIEDTTWQDDMNEVEKLKKALEDDDEAENDAQVLKYVMNPVSDGRGLRYRLTAVGEYRDVVSLKRLQDVKRNGRAKAVKNKYLKPCTNCCCFSHCAINCSTVQAMDSSSDDVIDRCFPTSWPDVQQDKLNLLDRSWLHKEQFEEEVTTLGEPKKNLTELLSCVNTDLSDAAPVDVML